MKYAQAWADQINRSVTNPLTNVTAAEATRAMRKYAAAKGPEYTKTFLKARRGRGYRERLDSDDRNGLCCMVEYLRNA